MTYAPPTLTDLGTYWTSQGGVNLGIVGNQRHCAGYHLGKDRIFSDCACRPDGTCQPGKRWSDYSVSRARDKANVTNGASAIDLGALNGTFTELQKFSVWLVQQCQAGKCRDIREVIYSPDGKVVLRWESSDNQLHSGEGQGDLSHLRHTHISFFRDSEARDKRPYFAPYFALPDSSTEANVRTFTFDAAAKSGTVTVVGAGHKYLRLKDDTLHAVNWTGPKHGFGPVKLVGGGITGPTDTRDTGYIIESEASFVITADATFKPDALDAKHTVALTVDGVAKATVEV